MSAFQRRNVRATLNTPVIVRGADSHGRPFEVEGISVDFSRKGLGLRVPRELAAPGSRVSVGFPNRFEADAVVEWVRREAGTGEVRIGVRILESRMPAWLRVAAAALLCITLVGQASFARSRESSRGGQSCTMSLEKMRSMLEERLGLWASVGESEKAFLHVQHEQTDCKRYTKNYEKSKFYSDKNKRTAVARWHWKSYHSKDEAVRLAALRSAETVLGGN